MLSAPDRWENRIPLFVKLYFGLISSGFRVSAILNVNLSVDKKNTLLFLELLFEIALHLMSLDSCPLIIAVDLFRSP